MKECKLYHLHGRYYLVCWDRDLDLRITYKKRGDWLVNIEDATDAIRFDEVVDCTRDPEAGGRLRCRFKGAGGFR